ncbi:hypothetical protein BDY21DRAFT_272119, partial [Lineolata rhizophorae]
QCSYLDNLLATELPQLEMTVAEASQKDVFRASLSAFAEQAIDMAYGREPVRGFRFRLCAFGSLASGFALKGSDLDLAFVVEVMDPLPGAPVPSVTAATLVREDGIPRVLELAYLNHGLGARLLSRTRVPILKVCEKPTKKLYTNLIKEREKWQGSPVAASFSPAKDVVGDEVQSEGASRSETPQSTPNEVPQSAVAVNDTSQPKATSAQLNKALLSPPAESLQSPDNDKKGQSLRSPVGRMWTREKALGPLDFPKHGVGIQCDINFSNPLGIHNSHMLRCYSLCDPRVRPIVLFVKAWAKRRKINSPYSGTLSSYGYVLMALHYLVNVARPPVLPNLQHFTGIVLALSSTEHPQVSDFVNGYQVRYFGDETTLSRLAADGKLTANSDPVGVLLRGFFQYFAVPVNGGFNWAQDVLSLRTPGGIRSKIVKGWTGAKTELVVRQRYLVAIEDPFETAHNVGRTVTRRGVDAIRDEFRRAWRVLDLVGERGGQGGADEKVEGEGGLLDELAE